MDKQKKALALAAWTVLCSIYQSLIHKRGNCALSNVDFAVVSTEGFARGYREPCFSGGLDVISQSIVQVVVQCSETVYCCYIYTLLLVWLIFTRYQSKLIASCASLGELEILWRGLW